MEKIFVLVKSSEWEDIVIFLSQEEAIQSSIKFPRYHVEIFEKRNELPGFEPSYSYYKNGEYYKE